MCGAGIEPLIHEKTWQRATELDLWRSDPEIAMTAPGLEYSCACANQVIAEAVVDGEIEGQENGHPVMTAAGQRDKVAACQNKPGTNLAFVLREKRNEPFWRHLAVDDAVDISAIGLG